MLGAIVSFTSMAVGGREVAAELDTFELMMYRSFIGVFLVLGFAGMAGTLRQIGTSDLSLHLVRNISHFFGQNCWFAAISLIPIAQVVALEFSTPIWVAILAPLVLGERLTSLRLLVAAMGFVGVVIVAQPQFNNLETGVILAALAAVGFAGSILCTKLLTRRHSITNILFWLTVMQLVLGIAMAGYDGDIAIPSAKVLPWVALVACAGLCAHFCLTTALSLAPAVSVVPLDFMRLPLMAAVGAWLYGETLDPLVLLGAGIIIAANYLNLVQDSRDAAKLP